MLSKNKYGPLTEDCVIGCVQIANISALPNGKQQLVGNSDMAKPPREQTSSLEENKPCKVSQPKRIFQLEEKFQGSSITPLNRLAIVFECARIRLQIDILLRPRGGHHFDGMVTAAPNFLPLSYRFNNVDASDGFCYS